jgi:tRNA threonylcarbamoyladenosine biosynthesis protein TsaB
MILLIETSGKTCSIALADKEKCISFREQTSANFKHAELVNLYIEEVLEEAKITPDKLSAIAVSGGPGSYTGLRIGTSSAKGLCYALDIPLIVVDTLLGMTSYFLELNPAVNAGAILYPMINARRLEVFTQKLSTNLEQLGEVYPLILDENTFYSEESEIIFFGDGADKLIDKIDFVNNNISIVPDFNPSAKGLIKLSYAKFLAKDFADLAYFEPNYLKEFKVG